MQLDEKKVRKAKKSCFVKDIIFVLINICSCSISNTSLRSNRNNSFLSKRKELFEGCYIF